MSRATALFAASAALSCVFWAGCAAPGAPTPPRPVVPIAVTDLAAHQAGDSVLLEFTLPRQSTAQEPLAEPPSVEIYRASLSPGSSAGPKTAWRLAYAIPSERVNAYLKGNLLEFRDPLTAEELAHVPGLVMAYMVRTTEAKGHASPDSNAVTVPTYPAPPTPAALQAKVTQTAIVISWNVPPPPANISIAGTRIYRAEFHSESEAAAATQNLSTMNLQPVSGLIPAASPAEFRDATFAFGNVYVYLARTVAHFGAATVESADSLPVVITPRDIFPPAAPQGLEAVGIPASAQTPAYVELTWSISPEADLAGYRVYRSEQEGERGEKIGPALLPSPAFHDNGVTPGQTYFYRVSAVDRSGNESPLSAPVRVEVPLREP